MTTVPDSDLLEKTPDEQEPTTSPPKDDPIIENADEVFAALRDYGRALVRVKGWRVAAQELGVSRRTMNLWLKADYVGRLLPQLFGELFDGDLDRLIRETGTLMKQRKWKDDDPAPEADQQQNSPAEHVPSPAPPEDDWMLSDGDDEVGELPDEVEMMDEVAQAVSESESTILTADRREELAQEESEPSEEEAEEVTAQLKNYVLALTQVKGWRGAAQDLGVSTRTLHLWLRADHVGRRLPQLFGELFDGDLDRLIRETGTLMKQSKWKDDDPAPEADQQQNSPAEHVPSPVPPEDDWMVPDGDDEVGELPDKVEMVDEVAQAVSESESTILTADRKEEPAQEESEPSEEEAAEVSEEVRAQLKNYVLALTQVKGWKGTADELGVSTRTLHLWLRADHVGRRLPQLLDELFDGKLDRLMMATNALIAQIPDSPVDAIPVVSDSAFAWIQSLMARKGAREAADLLGVDKRTLTRGLARGAPLSGFLGDRVAETYKKVRMAEDPTLTDYFINFDDLGVDEPEDAATRHAIASGIVDPNVWVGARSAEVITTTPYPDEKEYFGEEVAFQAERWRALRISWIEDHYGKAKEGIRTLEGLITREEMYAVELELIGKHGKTLVTDPNASNMAVWAPLPRREQISWREKELASVREERERVEAAILRRENLKRFLRRSWQATCRVARATSGRAVETTGQVCVAAGGLIDRASRKVREAGQDAHMRVNRRRGGGGG